MPEARPSDDLSPDTPVGTAAERALAARLAELGRQLKRASNPERSAARRIHDLRVGARRTVAQFDVFADCVPDKVAKSLRKRVRAIRRKTGDLRDGDILLTTLESAQDWLLDDQRPGLYVLLGATLAQRQHDAERWYATCGKLAVDLDDVARRTLRAVEAPDGRHVPTLQDLASVALPPLREEFDNCAAKALQNDESLHDVRILAKRLRYTLELFVGCTTTTFPDAACSLLKEVQDGLGTVNDARIVCQHIEKLRETLSEAAGECWQRFTPGIEALLIDQQRCIEEGIAYFKSWWSQWQDRAGSTDPDRFKPTKRFASSVRPPQARHEQTG